MHTQLSEMSDQEFFGEVCRVISHLASGLAMSHSSLRDLARGGSMTIRMSNALLTSSIETMNGLGNICNAIDCIDDAACEWTSPVFEEARRRFPKVEA